MIPNPLKKMKLLVAFAVIVLFITGCTKFTILTKIEPKVEVLGDVVGIDYKLGSLQISDQLEPSSKMIAYIQSHPKGEYKLKVTYNLTENTATHFTYFINGIVIIKNKQNVVDAEILIEVRDTIPGFVCASGSCKNNSEESEKIERHKPHRPKPPVENNKEKEVDKTL